MKQNFKFGRKSQESNLTFNEFEMIRNSYNFASKEDFYDAIERYLNKRNNERFFNADLLNVLVLDKTGKTQKIGTIIIPQYVIDEVEANKKYITNPNLKLSEQIVFGVVLYTFNMVKLWKEITFEPNIYINDILKKLKNREVTLQFQAPDNNSFGTYIITYLKGNSILTTYYSVSNDKELIKHRMKRHFPKNENIVLYNPEDIDFYDDDIVTNNF